MPMSHFCCFDYAEEKKTHKDKGTLYLLFGAFSGMIGSSFSMLIRLEISSPGSMLGDNRLYLVVVTAHAFAIIF